MTDPVYLDHNATTPLLPAVIKAMLPYLTEHFGNPSSDHVYGHRGRDAVARARTQVAALIGCRDSEIYFTSGGTEANNLAILGLEAKHTGRRRIITSVVEHPATLMPCLHLERRGCEISRVGVDRTGMIKLDELVSHLQEQTTLITIMHANSETGTLQPIREICAVARRLGVPVHTDAAQTTGKVSFSVDDLGVDMLSIVGHKMYAPKGIGALYVREHTPVTSRMLGGGHERGLRSGTENVPYIVALGKACEIAAGDAGAEQSRVRGLCNELWERLAAAIPGLRINGHPDKRLPNTLNVRFPGVSGNAVLAHAPEIAASTGSACHADDEAASTVITAMGLSEAEALGSVRLSLGRGTSRDDVALAARVLERAYRELAG